MTAAQGILQRILVMLESGDFDEIVADRLYAMIPEIKKALEAEMNS